MSKHHFVYLIPGLFGFSKLAGYDYFVHVRNGIERAFDEAGVPVTVRAVATLPTASIRRRGRMLARSIAAADNGSKGPIHLIGHSTGGLEARLVLTPGVHLQVDPSEVAWVERTRSLVTFNTPHFGTPVAEFFASAAGTRVLFSLSLVTIAALVLGKPALGVLSRAVTLASSVDQFFGLDSQLVDRSVSMVLRVLDSEARDQIRNFLRGIRHDRGGLYQVTPEGMDIFNAATIDAEAVRYGWVGTSSHRPGLSTLRAMKSPAAALTAGLYSSLYGLTGRARPIYPYAKLKEKTERTLARAIGWAIDEHSSDGIVPTQSMAWGDLVWAGPGDHLDVLGHFQTPESDDHVDWMCSGTPFTLSAFRELIDSTSRFMMNSC